MIKITVEKLIKRGVKMVKVLEIEGILTEIELPEKYYYSEGIRVYSYYNDNKTKINHFVVRYTGFNHENIYIGTIYKTEFFDKILGDLRIAAENLKNINKELAKENKNYKGIETFII